MIHDKISDISEESESSCEFELKQLIFLEYELKLLRRLFANMVELVYTGDLKSPGESHAGSNPAVRTFRKLEISKSRFFRF